MSDPSTLLLIACASCGNTNPNSDYQENLVCAETEALSQTTVSVGLPNLCHVSPPETTLIALASDVSVAQVQKNPATRELSTDSPTIEASGQPTSPVTITTPLRLGSQGATVTQLQKQLRSLGYYQGIVDGRYGPQTVTAVSQFQKSRNLKVDGIVGSQTWSLLVNDNQVNAPIIEDKSNQELTTIPSVVNAPQTSSPEASNSVKMALPNPELLGLLTIGWSVIYFGGWVFIVKGFRQEMSGLRFVKISVDQEFEAFPNVEKRNLASKTSFVPKSELQPTLVKKASQPAQKAIPEKVITAETQPSNNQDLSLPVTAVSQVSESKLNNDGNVSPVTPKSANNVVSMPQPVASSQPVVQNNVQNNATNYSPAPEESRVSKDVKYTLVAVISSNQTDEQEGYTYALIDDAEGRFLLEGNQLFIPDTSLPTFKADDSYNITIRRTNAQGSSVYKSFKVDIPAEAIAA